jgi:hypothetical protein
MRVEWWYDDATFHRSGNSELVLARLTVRGDGSSQVLLGGGEVIELENEPEASRWLVDEEYRRLDDLVQDCIEDGVPVDPRLRPPAAAADEDLIRQMVVVLGPRGEAVVSERPGTPPAPP